MDSISKKELKGQMEEIYGDFVTSETESIETINTGGDPDGSLKSVISHSQGAQAALNTLAERLGISIMDDGSPR